MHESRRQRSGDVLARARAFGFRLVFRDDNSPTPWAWQQDGQERASRFPSRTLALDYIEDRLRRVTYFT